jgi:hypothetical protein
VALASTPIALLAITNTSMGEGGRLLHACQLYIIFIVGGKRMWLDDFSELWGKGELLN